MSGREITSDAAFEALLQFLKRSRGFDFTGYKRASLERRFRRRMDTVACKSFGDYLDYLEVHPEEYQALFDTLLINVTDFFRDPPTWDQVRDDALPLILDGKPADEPLRVWSAGCATGQEPYTIAIVLCEALGEDSYRRRVKIYATDIDEDALNTARQATYAEREVEHVPPELRERYFERVENRFAFRTDLRRAVIFGRNNLVQDAPISRLDLLVCRNTLMYLNAETQGDVLRHFHFALRDTGVLMLGKSEMMIAHRDLFAALDLKQRIFRKLPRTATMQARVAEMVNGERGEHTLTDEDRRAQEVALELSLHPQLIVSRSGLLTFANVAARALFELGSDHIGRPLAELPVAREPVQLMGPIEQALTDRRRISLGEFAFAPIAGEERRLAVTVAPLLSDGNVALGTSVAFEDVTGVRFLQRELETARNDLDAAYEELQSTIEELETMNEELHSTNAELETINDELRERTGELNSVNDFLEAILTSLGVAVAVVDRNQRVQIWNRGAEELWGLRQDEAAEQHFLALDIGLAPERLAPALRAVMGGASEKETARLQAVNRRGRTIVCDTTVMPLLSRGADGPELRGAIVLMEDHGADGDGRVPD